MALQLSSILCEEHKYTREARDARARAWSPVFVGPGPPWAWSPGPLWAQGPQAAVGPEPLALALALAQPGPWVPGGGDGVGNLLRKLV